MTREELYQKYIVEDWSRQKCADFFNTTESKIKTYLKNYGIQKHVKKENQPSTRTWKIYKHTNKINGKCYIGITKLRRPCSRWRKNGKGYKQVGQWKLWRAIEKYGWDNFDHEIIEDNILTPELANEREKYWIAYYDSFKHGYNATLGGSGATGHIPSEESRRINGIKHKGKAYHTQKHSEETKRKISEAHKGEHLSPGTEFKKGHQTWIKGRVGEFGKPILQYSPDGNFIKEWPNVYVAVKYFSSKSESCIRQCCKGNRKRYKGYIWRYKDGEIPQNVDIQELIDVRHPVLQYDLEGNLVAEYESVIEAFRKTGFSRSSIARCCSGKTKNSHGYIWKYK